MWWGAQEHDGLSTLPSISGSPTVIAIQVENSSEGMVSNDIAQSYQQVKGSNIGCASHPGFVWTAVAHNSPLLKRREWPSCGAWTAPSTSACGDRPLGGNAHSIVRYGVLAGWEQKLGRQKFTAIGIVGTSRLHELPINDTVGLVERKCVSGFDLPIP